MKALLFMLILLCAAPALAVEDVTGPALTAFTISPVSIETSTGAQSVTITCTITDGLAGFDHGSFYFVSPGLIQNLSVGFNSAQLTSGDIYSGVYAITVTWPRYSNIGAWRLTGGSITDAAGNYTAIPEGDSRFNGYTTVTTF